MTRMRAALPQRVDSGIAPSALKHIPQPAAPQPGSPRQESLAPGTAVAQRFFTGSAQQRPLCLWGSSSMSSEGGAEGTPLAVRIHEHLTLANAPQPVHAYGVGATRSQHTLLMRGLLTPEVRIRHRDRSSGAAELSLGNLAPAGPIRFPGSIDGIAGILDGSKGRWLFTPRQSTAELPHHGTFTSDLVKVAEGARHLVWMGKNNIMNVDQVLEDTHTMWKAAPDDTLVMGHWPTIHDAIGSPAERAMQKVNTELAKRYKERFLDVRAALASEDGLQQRPVAPLRLMEQADTHLALDQGVVPPGLVASDEIHLNGWGNLAVSAAIVRRMRELRWL